MPNHAVTESERVALIEETIRKIVEAIISRPEQFELTTRDDGTTVYVSMTANIGDAKRIVGKGGKHLVMIREVARLACWGLRLFRRVEFGYVQSAEAEENQYADFVGSTTIDREPIKKLVNEVLGVLFPGAVVSIAFEQRDQVSDWMRVQLSGGALLRNGAATRVKSVGRAFAELFVVIGMKSGRIIYASVEGDDRRDHAGAHAVGGASRRVHIPGSQSESGESEVHGEHRGQLGPRDVHLRGLGGSTSTGAEARRKTERSL